MSHELDTIAAKARTDGNGGPFNYGRAIGRLEQAFVDLSHRIDAVEKHCREDTATVRTVDPQAPEPPATLWAWLAQPRTPQLILYALLLVLALFGAAPFAAFVRSLFP